MKKLDKIGHYNKETGEEITQEILLSVIKEDTTRHYKSLQNKFDKKAITKQELLELMEYKKISKTVCYKYQAFYKVNMVKPKPKGISYGEYGKFFMLLNFLSYKNTLAHKNGKAIKKEDLSNHLGYTNLKRFKTYINKLAKYKMIALIKLGGIEYICINPAYAQRNMALNSTIYKLFEEDLREGLDEYQIRLLELQEEGVDISSVVPIH